MPGMVVAELVRKNTVAGIPLANKLILLIDAKKNVMPRYSKASQQKVKEVMEEMKAGQLSSGRNGKKVTSRKQAIAIGLSEARKQGSKVPLPKKKD